MRPDQSVYEMVEEVLERQSRILAERTGCSRQEARQAVLRTRAARELRDLRDGPHAREKVSSWQENLLWGRALERLEHVARLDAEAARSVVQERYTWLDGYLEWLEGKEARAEYYALLEEHATLRP